MKEILRIQVEKITGLADEAHTCSVFSKRVAVNGDSVGSLVGCVLAGNGDTSDLQTTLHGLFEFFSDKLESSGLGVGDRVLEALTEAKSFILERSLEAGFAICFFYQNVCYVTRLGNKVRVWTYKGEKSKELSFEYGSGPYSTGQIFVIGTEKFFSTFNTQALLLGGELDLEDVIDGLATDISSSEKQSEIGVAFVKIDGGEQETQKKENLDNTQTQEEQVDEPARGEVLNAPEVVERDEVDGEVFEAGERISSKKSVFNFGKAIGSFFAVIFAEAGKLKRGDIRAIFRLRRNLVLAALLLLLILTGSAYFTINGQKQASKTAEFNKQIESARSNLAEGESIISLNNEKARSKLIQAGGDISRALALFPKDKEALGLKNEVESKLKETENVSGLPFREVADVGENLVGISLGKGKITAFLDDKIVDVSDDGKVGDKINSQSGTSNGFVWDKSAFVTAGGKIIKIDLGTGKKEDVASIGSGQDLAVFLGNVYVLDGEQIMKFVPIEKGYGEGQNYLEKKETFSDTSRFAIDGLIWVSQKNQILKYNRGRKEDFSVQGLVQTEVNFGKIYTNADTQNIYVVDRLNGVLLVIKKDGVYQRVYQSPEFKNNPLFVVDEAQGKVYIASGNKILVANL